jgi:hypothetical protein
VAQANITATALAAKKEQDDSPSGTQVIEILLTIGVFTIILLLTAVLGATVSFVSRSAQDSDKAEHKSRINMYGFDGLPAPAAAQGRAR